MDTNIRITTLSPVDTVGFSAGRSTSAASSGNTLPQDDKNSPAAKPSNLGDAVRQLQDHAQSVQRNLEFSVDESSGETVVKVVASDTGELIRQIPSEVALKLAESLKESGNLLFERA